MTITQTRPAPAPTVTDVAVERRGATDTTRSTKAIATVAAALLAAALVVVGVRIADSDDARPAPSIQATQPRPSEREVLRDLVNRGIVPSAALVPVPTTQREMLEDLVNRGVIPAESLLPDGTP